MAKNIVIFSDGTGQAGGLLPDETRSNVYKLYRAARICPDTDINPAEQLAFYDYGLGSKAAGSDIKIGWWRWLYNILGQATGLGITRNIIDCYAAILRVWEPGDRIYLVGFSRGAYTVRCVGGALSLCGVPTQAGPGQPLLRDPAAAKAIATQAIKHVYQFGSSLKGDPYRSIRIELARRFRERHVSAALTDPALSNAYPYFIGVWDTVATLGLTKGRTLGLAVAAILGVGLIAVAGNLLRLWFVPGDIFDAATYWRMFAAICGLGVGAGAIAYAVNYTKFTRDGGVPWRQTLHTTGWRMELYDTELNRHVQHARHALAIDENREDFDKVPWTLPKDAVPLTIAPEDAGKGVPAAVERKDDGRVWLKQVWFAGVHSDIGGSYAETEARLSDIALGWMIDEAAGLPEPLKIDRSVLHLWPSATGPQHDERKSTVAGWPTWVVWLLTQVWKREELGWESGVRKIPRNAPLHPSVLERFKASDPGVLHYDVTAPYRPENLRLHRDTHAFYEPPAAPQAGA